MLPFMRLCSYFLLAVVLLVVRMPALPTAVPIRVGTALASGRFETQQGVSC